MAFTSLCPADAIGENTSKQFELDGVKLFVVNERGIFYAYRNQCPHLGIELQWQEDKFLDFDGEMIQCSTHGALFLMHNGECVAGPCRGKSLHAIDCTLLNGQVCVDLDEQQ